MYPYTFLRNKLLVEKEDLQKHYTVVKISELINDDESGTRLWRSMITHRKKQLVKLTNAWSFRLQKQKLLQTVFLDITMLFDSYV